MIRDDRSWPFLLDIVADGRSTRYDRHGFVALACRAEGRVRARSGPRILTALFDRTNAPRARQPGAAWGRRADRSRPGRGCRRYEEQTSPETYGRDITSSIFFSAFFFAGQGCDFFLREGKDFSFVRAPRGDGKSISMIPASLSSCYAGRGGKNKTEGLQYLEPKGNVLLGSPGERLTLRRQRNYPDRRPLSVRKCRKPGRRDGRTDQNGPGKGSIAWAGHRGSRKGQVVEACPALSRASGRQVLRRRAGR